MVLFKKQCIIILSLFLFLFLSGFSQNIKTIEDNYTIFLQEWEKQMALHDIAQNKVQDSIEKVLTKLPSGFSGLPFSDSSYYSIGISDPLNDSLLAYNMALERALAVASILSGTKGSVYIDFFNTEENISTISKTSTFTQYFTFVPNHFVSLKAESKPSNIRLSSGETIIFLTKNQLHFSDSLRQQKRIKLEIWKTEYNFNETYTPIKRLSLSQNKPLDQGFFEWEYTSSGKKSYIISIVGLDTISYPNSIFKYYDSLDTNKDTISGRAYPLNQGLWPAFINAFTSELISISDHSTGENISGMSDLFKSGMKAYVKNFNFEFYLNPKIKDLGVYTNGLFLQLTNRNSDSIVLMKFPKN